MGTKYGRGTASICVGISVARHLDLLQLNSRCVVGFSDDNTIFGRFGFFWEVDSLCEE